MLLSKQCEFLGRLSSRKTLKTKNSYWNSLQQQDLKFKSDFWHSQGTLCGAVVQLLSLLHSFIHQSLNSGSAQVQILLTAYQRFVMMRISDNSPSWKKATDNFSFNHSTKIVHHHHHHHHHCWKLQDLEKPRLKKKMKSEVTEDHVKK